MGNFTTNVETNNVFRSMAVVYGFFFIFLSAIASMTSNVVQLYESRVFDLWYRIIGLGSFYILVLIIAFAMVFLGGGLMRSIVVMNLNEDYRIGFFILMTVLPIVYSLVIGFLLHLPLPLIVLESVVVSILVLIIVRSLRKDLGGIFNQTIS